jgi:hypothetical protein
MFPCKLPNATWAASNEFDQPSMIALASSRTLDVAALLVEGLPTIRSGCKIEMSTRCFKTLFSIRSINRDFHALEAQFTAMDIRGYGEWDQEQW